MNAEYIIYFDIFRRNAQWTPAITSKYGVNIER